MTPVLMYHHCLFDRVAGSSESLLRSLALILADSGQFVVHMVYGIKPGVDIEVAGRIANHPNIRLHPFHYDHVEVLYPCRVVGMAPEWGEIVSRIDPRCFIGLVWSDNQILIRELPRDIPVMLISPFGNICSNGNLRRLYVSGQTQMKKLVDRGIDICQVFFNPVPIPAIKERKLRQKTADEAVVFGRCGRPDPAIFDPISLEAFARLEAEYGASVKYIYVNPSDEARKIVAERNLKQVEFRQWLSEQELLDFYEEVDVFAHARRDGETIGIAIGEALLHQNPVVSHKSLAFNDHMVLLDGPFARVAEVGDVDAYYQGMKFFVDNKGLLPELGLQAREFATRFFDWDIIGASFLKDVQDVCGFYGIPGMELPAPPEDSVFDTIRAIFAQANQGQMTMETLLSYLDMFASVQNFTLLMQLLKTWLANAIWTVPPDSSNLFAAAEALAQSGRDAEAFAAYREILVRLAPQHLTVEAALNVAANHLQNAGALYQRVLQVAPNQPQASQGLARLS